MYNFVRNYEINNKLSTIKLHRHEDNENSKEPLI